MPIKTRGYYEDKSYLKWSKDKTDEYFGSTEEKYLWPFAKLMMIATVFAVVQGLSGSLSMTLGLCLFVIIAHQHVIALVVPNTIVMPAMDLQTFMSDKYSNVNYINCQQYDSIDGSEIIELRLKEAMKKYPKFRYNIKKIMGDYYYEEMTYEEAVKKIFVKLDSGKDLLKNQADIDAYVRDNINKRIPIDGPLVRVYC